MINWMLITMIIVAILAVNSIASNTIYNSKLLSKSEKQFSLALIWLIPFIGVIISTKLFSNKVKKNKEINEEKMVNALNRFTHKIKSINEDIKQQHNNNKPN